jgi:23S rRNA pseudouridine2604 synthase
MCEQLDYKVAKLKRVRIMNISLDVGLGKWRYFSENELIKMNQLLGESSKTNDN